MDHPESERELDKLLSNLERRCEAGYRARLHAQERLARSARMWDVAQAMISVSMIALTIALFAGETSEANRLEVLLLIASVVMLAVSILVSGRDYSGRARDMFYNYRTLQKLWVRAESVRKLPSSTRVLDYEALLRQYDSAIDGSENHLESDHNRRRYGVTMSQVLAAILMVAAVVVTLYSIWLAWAPI